jgi:hypothetical protein
MHYEKPTIVSLTVAELENAQITATLQHVGVGVGDGTVKGTGPGCQCQCQCQCQGQASG